MGMHILLYLLHVPSKHLVLIKFLLENELILEVFFIKHVSQILDLIASSLYCGEQKKIIYHSNKSCLTYCFYEF